MNGPSFPGPAEPHAGSGICARVRCMTYKAGDESGKSLAGWPVIKSDRRVVCHKAAVYAILNEVSDAW
jgi:hypothetical protein